MSTLRIIEAHTPGQPRAACAYGPDWWAVLERDGALVAAPLGTMNEREARIEAVRHEGLADKGVALVRFYHVAYNIAPSVQARADWVLEAASAALGTPYREGGGDE